MHTLARGCPAKRRLPRVRSPRVIHSCRECIWGFGFDSACEQHPMGGRAMPLGRHTGPDAIRHPARSPRPGICNPYRIEFYLGSQPGVATCRGNPGLGYASPSDLFRAPPDSGVPRRFSVASGDRRQIPVNVITNHSRQSTTHGCCGDKALPWVGGRGCDSSLKEMA